MRPGRLLTPVLAVLVPGCVYTSSSGCGDFDPAPVRDDVPVYPPWSEVEPLLDDDGELTAAVCEQLCSAEDLQADRILGCRLAEDDAAATAAPELETGDTGAVDRATVICEVESTPICIGGRDHAAIGRRERTVVADPVATFLARSALDEATSVKAFVSLAIELRRLGAPPALVAGARAAALDEIGHARLLGRLARARGGVPGRAELRPTPVRSVLAFATENAVEGCVHETWAALVATHQSVHASDPQLASAYARVARDEARHGDLAWEIDAWVATRLDTAGREAVARARRRAIEQLAASLVDPHAELVARAGLPTLAEARRLLEGLCEHVWTPAARAA